MQASLFSDNQNCAFEQIDGLVYLPDFISLEEEQSLFSSIDQQPWITDLKRRVQHYGWRYDYATRRIDASMRLGDLPAWVMPLAQRLVEQECFAVLPDQVIVNEYVAGQGIAPHVDCVPCFEECIASLSLGSACVMDFVHGARGQKLSHLLAPRSLLLLSGAARYDWKHGIAARKRDRYEGAVIERRRRVSLTFRKVFLSR